jgi:hypothetical protein
MNHWISTKGSHDVCMACGETVPNVGQAEPPVIITGTCKGARPIRMAPDSRDVAIVVCRRCGDNAPYLGHSDLEIEVIVGRPGWCTQCHRFMGDKYVVVPARPPVQDLVQAYVDAAGAIMDPS